MDAMPAPAARERRAKFLIGGGLVLLALIALITWALTRENATSFFYSPTEVLALGADAPQGDYRVNGNVLPDTVEREGTTTSFTISDGRSQIDVTTDAPLPDAFWTAMDAGSSRVEVIAQGRLDGSLFEADQVLAKCPSKFKAKAEAQA